MPFYKIGSALLLVRDKRLMMKYYKLLFLIILLTISGVYADENPIDFSTMSLEELKNVEIISVSKKPEKISDVGAAVFVISAEDIRRSGVTSIPEALRMAPGVQVARIGPTDWAVTIRGLNQQFSNNILVLIDGRSVYTPIFSGVFWDIQDTVLEDIERIEIIRGPGGTVWGANAVNGVINIITKKAKDTSGGLLTVLAGTQEGQSATVRYGGKSGENTFYRVYAKHFNRDQFDMSAADCNNSDFPEDNWRSLRSGFRADTESESDSLTLLGEVFANRYDAEFCRILLSPPYTLLQEDVSESAGGHLMGRWQHNISETSDILLQLYYDHTEKDHDMTRSAVRIGDADLRHRFYVFPGHEIVWGAGYRLISDEFSVQEEFSDPVSAFQPLDIRPSDSDKQLYSAFVQDTMLLIPNNLSLTLGTRLEHNDCTGLEIQPGISLLWKLSERTAFWASAARAVRTPSRIESGIKKTLGILDRSDYQPIRDIFGPDIAGAMIPDAPVIITAFGNDRLDSETLIAYQIGYRAEPAESLFLEFTAFYNKYDKLIVTTDPASPYPEVYPSLHYVIPFYYNNSMKGEAYGMEISGEWQALPQWRLAASYSFLKTRLHWTSFIAEVSEHIATEIEKKSNPCDQFSLRSSADLGRKIQLDAWLRYVDRLSDNENDIESYTTLDTRISWKPLGTLELSVTGQNLLGRQHKEFSPFEVERSVYFKLDWRF